MRLLLLFLILCTPALSQQAPRPFAAFDLASEPVLNDPHDLDLGPDGRIYVADKFAGSVAVFDPETLELVEVIGDGTFPGIHDIAFGPDGQTVVAVTGLSTVMVFSRFDGRPLPEADWLPAARTEGAVWHENGRVYVTAGGTGDVIAYQDGRPVASAGGHFGAHDIDVAPDGSLWVADNFNRRLVRYSPDLELLQIIDHPRFGLIGARYLDVDEFGRLVVADQDAHRILLIDPEGPDGGALLGVLGDGSPGIGPGKFDDPEGVLILGDRYYFADSDNNRIVRYSIVIN